MATICPTVTARNPHAYRTQVERIAAFAHRIHFDFTDGIFAKHLLTPLHQAWWPVGVRADFHLMYRQPAAVLPQVIHLRPHLVIVHAEADGSFTDVANQLRAASINVGLAILQSTSVETIAPVLPEVDHVLVFSGDLGSYGGTADLSLLDKVAQLKQLQPELEVSWDGGINADNAAQLVRGGVDVLNVGGYIQHARDPETAYQTLQRVISG